jgi:dihydrofolate synthase / folylpolyglutamate synthase
MGMTQKDPYNECLEKMYGFRRFGIILGLSAIRNILKALGNPQNRFSTIHIAGTNGKGSVAATLSAVLKSAGYRVGLFTSPHLVRFNERICIDSTPISDADVVKAFHAVQSIPMGKREPTFFEFSTAMALNTFAEKGVDWAVIETGMGGRLDATNIIRPKLSVITNISLEHRMYLGNTIAKISAEKGGIIKYRVPVVTGVQQKTAISTLESLAASKSAPFYRRGDAFRVRRQPDGTFTYYGMDGKWQGMKNGLIGTHQVENAALVLAACEILSRKKVDLSLPIIKKGLLNARWPGRLEIARSSPFLILDGAHNFIAARTLKKYLTDHLSDRKITMVIGILDDKPYQSMLQSLLPGCARVIVTRAKIDRALPPESLYDIARKIIPDTAMIPNVADAVKFALKTTLPKDAVVVAGSLYVVGEAKAYLEKKTR